LVRRGKSRKLRPEVSGWVGSKKLLGEKKKQKTIWMPSSARVGRG